MVVRFLAYVVALAIATALLPGITLDAPTGVGDVIAIFVVAFIFGTVNAAVRPLFHFAIRPIHTILLGIALLVVNAGLLLFTSWVCGRLHIGWRVDGLPDALLGGFIVGVVSFVVNALFGKRGEEHR